MRYRQLGSSGLRVSALTLGTMTFGGGGSFRDVGQTDLEGARRQIDMALDAGVNLIDTANMYSAGAAESILGRALNGRRDRVVLATKARFPIGLGPNDSGLSRHHLIEACDASLRRLGTDHIDLYQVHELDGQTPVEETLAALQHLVQSRKVRYVGCSNFAGLAGDEGTRDRRPKGLPRFVSQQVYLSLQERSAEYEIVPSAIDQGLGVLIWSPLAEGLLSGKYRRAEPAPPRSRRAGEWAEPPVYDKDKLFDTVDVVVEIAEDHDVSAAWVALDWLLARPGITTVIVGARTDEQLADNLTAAELVLSDEDISRLETVSRPPPIYPFWRQRNTAADRLSAADLSLIRPHLPDGSKFTLAGDVDSPGWARGFHLPMTDTNPHRADVALASPASATAAEPRRLSVSAATGPAASTPVDLLPRELAAGQPSAQERARSVRLLNRLLARLTHREQKEFVLQVVQPSLVGMIDGTVSTLAPIFAAAVSSSSRTALLVGIATALGAGVSMGISEALSDTGEQTGRGSAVVRGTITGAATTFGGIGSFTPFRSSSAT